MVARRSRFLSEIMTSLPSKRKHVHLQKHILSWKGVSHGVERQPELFDPIISGLPSSILHDNHDRNLRESHRNISKFISQSQGKSLFIGVG